MALSDTGIRSAKAKPKQYKFYDEGGLFLFVKPSGGKLWRSGGDPWLLVLPSLPIGRRLPGEDAAIGHKRHVQSTVREGVAPHIRELPFHQSTH